MRIEGFRTYFLLVLLASCQQITFAQTLSKGVSRPADSVAIPSSKAHSLYFTSGYSDNLVIASSVSHRQPYYSAAISYFIKNSFYLSASSFHLDDYQPFSAFNVLTAGYYNDFYSWLDVNLSLSGYKIPEQLENTLFKSFINADLKAGIDWKLIYTEVSASSIFGEGSGFFYEMKNSKYVQIPGIPGKKLHISIQPYAEFIFGSMVKIRVADNTFTGIRSPVVRWGNRSLGEDIATEESNDASQGGSPQPESSGPGPGNGPGNEEDPAPGTENDPVQGGNSEGPSSPDTEKNPGPGENSDPNSQTGTQTGSDGGPQTGHQNGGENNTEIPNGQSGEDPDQSGESGQDDDNSPEKSGPGAGSKGAGSFDATDPDTKPELNTKNFLGLMEFEIGLPVTFTRGRFIFEVEPGYVKSMYNDPYIAVPEGFTFTMSLYIKIF